MPRLRVMGKIGAIVVDCVAVPVWVFRASKIQNKLPAPHVHPNSWEAPALCRSAIIRSSSAYDPMQVTLKSCDVSTDKLFVIVLPAAARPSPIDSNISWYTACTSLT